jgi:predicted TIM-barrel fold metal-dependent hydrolase
LLGYGVTAPVHCIKRKYKKHRRQTDIQRFRTVTIKTKNKKNSIFGSRFPFQKYETGTQPSQIAKIKAVVEYKTPRQKNRSG